MRGRWRRYPCERQAQNRYLKLAGLDPWNFDHPNYWLNQPDVWKDSPVELRAGVLGFAEDINGAWEPALPQDQQAAADWAAHGEQIRRALDLCSRP